MKLSPLTMFLIALSVGLIALSWAYFHQFAPHMQEAAYNNENADKLQIEADKMPLARRRVEKAVADVKDIATRWQAVVVAKTPPNSVAAGGIDLAVNRWQLTVDSRSFRNNIQRAVNAQLRRGGVRVIQGPEIPQPSESASNIVETFYNFPAIPFPVCMFDLGQVTVSGTFDQIVKNMESWRDMPGYLAVASGLQLTGTSPNLVGTYAVSLIAYIRSKDIYPPVPETAGNDTAPSFGGGGGGTGGGGVRGGGGGPIGGGQMPGGRPGGSPGSAGAGQAVELQ